LLVAVAGCGTRRERPPSRPNLLLVSIDTLRADHCSVYGYERRTTPVLERLAREGVVVETAYAPTATTAPSHAALLTSLYPHSTGVLRNAMILGPEHLTLAEILKAQGYRTSAVVSSFVLKRRFGFAQGFGTFECRFAPGPTEPDAASRAEAGETRVPGAPRAGGDEPPRRGRTEDLQGFERGEDGHLLAITGSDGYQRRSRFDRRADETTDLALAWLRRRGRDRPFFLWVHYFDPHDPYSPPPPFDSQFPVPEGANDLQRAVAAYDGEIAFTDRQLGRLVDALADQGLDDETLVVITADHGEGLLQHGYMGHGLHLYEEAVRVPLILRWPGHLPSGLRVHGLVDLLDVVPTALELLGVSREGTPFQGRSVAHRLTGERADPDQRHDRPAFFQRERPWGPTIGGTRVRGDKYGVRCGRWKYIEAEAEGTRELFDLAVDPGETRNLVARRPELAQRLSDTIATWRASTSAAPSAADDSDETLEALRALGYVE